MERVDVDEGQAKTTDFFIYRERSHILPNWNSGVSKRNTVSVFRKTMELYEHSLCRVLLCKINCGQPSLQLALEVFLPTRLSKA